MPTKPNIDDITLGMLDELARPARLLVPVPVLL
jgi:hypothetical protein